VEWFYRTKARGNIAIVKGKIHVDVKDVKNLITVFIVYVTLETAKGLTVAHNWLLTELAKLLICFAVFFIFVLIWNAVAKEKF
jgi:hypothetical protein